MRDGFNIFKALLYSMGTMALLFVGQTYAELRKDQQFVNDGNTRTYDIYIPGNIDSHRQRPLALLLHGHFGDADAMTGENRKKAPYKKWLSIAEREGWYLLIPDGSIGPDGYRGWNDCRQDAKTNPDSDDVRFLNRLVETVATKYPVDKKRVYAHGTSNGGNMAYRLAQETGDKYRAIAAVVSAMPKQLSLIHI